MKELKEKLIRGKALPPLNKIEDIHVVTGALKDFLRNLPEPLLTFHLNKAFMEAAGETKYSNCTNYKASFDRRIYMNIK